MMEFEKLSLATMAQGAAEEQFQRALAEAVANITDVNTSTKKPRRITVEIELLPSQNRDSVAIGITTKTKLSENIGAMTTAFIGVDDEGCVVAQEHNPKQLVIGEDNEPEEPSGENVTPFTKKEEEG